MHRAERRQRHPAGKGGRGRDAQSWRELHGDQWKGEEREAEMRDISQGGRTLAGKEGRADPLGGSELQPPGATAATAGAGGTSSASLSLPELRDRAQTEGKSHLEASLHLPPSHPVSLGSPMPAVFWDGKARELAQKEIGAPLYALYVGGEKKKKKKNPARKAVKVLSIQFCVYLGASEPAAPPLHVTQMCSGPAG